MKTILLALPFLLIIPAAQAAPSLNDPQTKQLLKAAESLNDICRNGLSDDKAQDAVCDARDEVYRALKRRQICYGKQNQATADWRWHVCDKGSM